MKLIVGFGNPGDRYANNRQNIGFKVIDIIANDENIDVRIKKKKSLIGRGKFDGQDVVLLKPQTFVNLIGESVLYIASFLRVNVKDVICIVEDPSLELGEIRVDYVLSRLNHEGIKSMEEVLKSDRFAKVRVGVADKAVPVENKEDFLLQDFTEEENLILIDVLSKTEEAVRMLMNHSIEEVQDKYNPEGAVKIKKRTVTVRKIIIDSRKNKRH